MFCYSAARGSDFYAHAAALAVEGIAAVGRENLLPPGGRLRPRHLSPGLSARNATPARAPATNSASR